MRENWPDAVRGIGIILVVLGHALRGLIEAGVLPATDWVMALDRGIYAFHMPLFFFLSGWFFLSALQNKSAVVLSKRLMWRIFYPLCLWTYIFIAVKLLAGSGANKPITVDDFWRLPAPGYLHLWFLWALFVVQLALIALRPMIVWRPIPILAGVCVISCLVYAFKLEGLSGPYFIFGLRFAPFFCVGALLGSTQVMPKTFWWAAMCGVGFLGVQLVLFYNEGGGRLFMLSAGLVCTLAIVSVAQTAFVERQKWLILLGSASMTIYLCHTIVSAGVRMILLKIDITAVAPHLILGVLMGLLLPLAFYLPHVPQGVRRVLGFGA